MSRQLQYHKIWLCDNLLGWVLDSCHTDIIGILNVDGEIVPRDSCCIVSSV